MKQKKNLVFSVIAIAVLVILGVIMFYTYNNFKPKAKEGSKEIVVEVVVPDTESKEFTINTDAEYLRQALDEAKLIEGSESEYGFFITGVNGRVADSNNQEWWCITKDDASIDYGVDMIAISDGDHYEITLTVGY